MSAPNGWFRALLDTAPDVYFRYAFEPARRLAYVSPSIETLTGRTPAELYADPGLCLAVVAGRDRRLIARVLRARRGLTLTLHVQRDGVAIPVELRTVALVKHRRIVAIEGVARLVVGASAGDARVGAGAGAASTADAEGPVQQRLAALMFEAHDLLHRVLPPAAIAAEDARQMLRIGDIALDPQRLIVIAAGQPVALTSRELLLLRYLLERPGRVVTRQQLLTDVWSYSYTGDDRTVDVHVSRLRRKLPSLGGRLVAIRNIGYRLDDEREAARVANSWLGGNRAAIVAS
jgi:DNA-binding winged helix-turn-helix (wHTH) protein